MRLLQNVDLKQLLEADRFLFFCLLLAFLSMPSGITPPSLLAFISLLVWLFSGKCFHFCRHALKLSWMWPILFFIVLTWIGLLYSPDVSYHGLLFAKKTHYYLYSLPIASLLFAKFPAEKLFQAFLWGLAINAIVGILQAIGMVPSVAGEFRGFGVGYRTLSAYLIIGMLYAAYLFGGTSERKIKIRYAVFIGLLFCHIILLKGRTGYYSLIVLAPVIVYFAFRKLGLLKNLSICLIAVCLMPLSPVVRQRTALTMTQLRHHLNADPSEAWGRVYTEQQDRFYMWYGAAQIILEHPFIGVGTGGYPVVLKEKGNPEWPVMRHPHNDILYMMTSFGFVGLFAYLWFFIEIIKNTWPHRYTPLGNFIFSATLVIIVSGFTNAQILDAGMVLLLSLIVGLQNGLPQFQTDVPENGSL